MILPLACALPLALAAREDPVPAAARFEFSAEPFARLVATLPAETQPAALAREDVAIDWNQPEAFERWRSALFDAGGSDPRNARARLTLFALRQGRADDAWQHLQVAGGDPGLLAALLPATVLGVAADPAGARGGLPGALPDGATLAPATPPRSGPPSGGRVERRSMRVVGLVVGEAVLAVRVAVEPEGVQVDVAHLAGGPARVAVRLPVEPGFRLANEYVDWYAAETPGAAHVVEIRPGDEEHTLYGRFEPVREVARFALPAERPAVLQTGGLVIRPAADEHARALASALARALAGQPLGLDARVAMRGEPAAEGGRAAIEVDVSDAGRASAKIAELCGAVERFVLR